MLGSEVVRYEQARKDPAPAEGLGSFRQGSFTYSCQPRPSRLSAWFPGFSSCPHLLMPLQSSSNVGRSGRRKGRFSRRPIPCLCGGDPCLALRPCSIEVARTANQSAARNHQRQYGQGLPSFDVNWPTGWWQKQHQGKRPM